MQIQYSESIGYDPERAGDSEREKLYSNIAFFLSDEKGEISLLQPENVNVFYDIFQPKDITVESTVGNVSNVFSTVVNEQITGPIQEAISLKAKIFLIEKLTELQDDGIATRVRHNHGKASQDNHPFKCEINLTRYEVNKTLEQIERLGMTGFKFFSGSVNQTPAQIKVGKILKEVGIDNIKSMVQVNFVLERLGMTVQAPKMKVQASASK